MGVGGHGVVMLAGGEQGNAHGGGAQQGARCTPVVGAVMRMGGLCCGRGKGW
jgi:hypothetical protein